MTLAICAQSFDKDTETFIREHVYNVYPGRSVLISRSNTDASMFGLPYLCGIRPLAPPRNGLERANNSLNFRWWRYVDPTLRGAHEARVRAFLQFHRVKAVLAEYGPNACLIRLACKRAAIPLFVHFHGYDATRLVRERPWPTLYRRLFKDAAGVIAPSNFISKRLMESGCPDDKIHVSPCGVKATYPSLSKRDEIFFLAVGRLVDKKAPILTIRAFAQLAQRVPLIRLEMIGDGPLRNQCLAEVASLGLAGRVSLLGGQPHNVVLGKLARAFAFVQHSVEAPSGDCEGLPVAILEAMANGLPVISTFHSGIPEAVVHETTGLLVAEGNVDGMARAMERLLAEPGLASSMGAAGRKRAQTEFTHERTGERLRHIMKLEA